jgi:hypothetical protein
MKSWVGTAASAIVSGTAASLAMTAALALLARKEGKGALQPLNSTSHWLHGEEAGSFRSMDLSHTAVGFGTHHLSALFWAAIFQTWLANRRKATALLIARDAALMSATAAAVEYGLTPKRVTPGWEEVLSKRSIAITYAVMALGLAAGALLAREWRLNEPTESSCDRLHSSVLLRSSSPRILERTVPEPALLDPQRKRTPCSSQSALFTPKLDGDTIMPAHNFDPKSMPGLSAEARDAVNAVFEAMSTWRTETANSSEKNAAQVIEKMAAAARALGWPEQIVDTTRMQMQNITKIQTKIVDQMMDIWEEQIKSPNPAAMLSKLKSAPGFSAGSWPDADALSAFNPFQTYMQLVEQWQKAWASAYGLSEKNR